MRVAVMGIESTAGDPSRRIVQAVRSRNVGALVDLFECLRALPGHEAHAILDHADFTLASHDRAILEVSLDWFKHVRREWAPAFNSLGTAV